LVSRTVVLDAGPLGLATNPKNSPQSLACAQWLQDLVAAGSRVVVPEISDYEVRRELLRAQKIQGLERLDALGRLLDYQPLTTAAMCRAAALWALARQQGQPTAADQSLDGDVILAAQAITLATPSVVIATTNVGHLARYVAADLWQNIVPAASEP
jgi:predicted nucleic acid-binding protein